MKTKQLLLFLFPRMTLWAMFVAPVWVVGSLLSVPEIVLATVLATVVMVYFRFQEDLVERIVPRFSVAQLRGR
jgi:hypothetical protein